MAGTKGKGTAGKKPAAKKKSAAPKKPAAKAKPSSRAASAPQGGSRGPVYLLVIMALLAVIVILANALFFGDRGNRGRGDGERRVAAGDRGTGEGTVERKDAGRDADGQKEKDREEKKEPVPVRQVKVFFIRVDDHTERIILSPVSRTLRGDVTVSQVIDELIKGPTASEKRRGLLSAVPSTLRVRGVTVKNRVAEIDFNGAIEQNAAGSILIGRLDQIVYTATELSGVDSVIVKINGRRRQSLGADGLSIGGPLHRRQ